MQRTQVYLTADQRKALDREAKRSGATLAEVIRKAVDRFLGSPEDTEFQRMLDETAGSMPDLEVPSRDEWDRGYG